MSHSFLQQHPSLRGFSESWGGMWRSLHSALRCGPRAGIKRFLEALLSDQDFIAIENELVFRCSDYDLKKTSRKLCSCCIQNDIILSSFLGVLLITSISILIRKRSPTSVFFLGGAFKRCFTRKPGEIIRFDNHFFQIGWFNHPPSFGIPGVFVVNSKAINPQHSLLEQKNRSPKIDQNSCIPEV